MTLSSDIERLVPARVLTIEPWIDPVVEAVGYELRDAYVEVFLASVVGPTGTLLLRRVGLGFAFQPQGFALDVDDTAAALGVGAGLGRNSPWWRTVARLARFGFVAGRDGQTLAVRRAVAPLSQRSVNRLPASLQRSHALALAQRAGLASARTAS